MRPKVVFLINSLTGGGAERILSRLLAQSNAWAGQYDLHLVLLDDEPDAYPIPDFVTVHRLESGFSLVKGAWRCIRLLRGLKPVVALSFLSRANIVNIAAARLLGHRAVISERVNASSHHPKTLTGLAARAVTRLAYPHAHRIICPSSGIARDLQQNFAVPGPLTIVVPNPIDLIEIRALADAEIGSPTSRPYAVAVGRLVENKNISLLLTAFSKARTDLDLVILGEGPLRGRLEAEVKALGLDGRVFLSGFAANPFPIVKAARLYVLSSNAEGFPNGLAEALALGVPCIATNCPSGPSDILDDREMLEIAAPYHGQYGILVPVNDAASLSDALEAMNGEEMQQTYAARALHGAERYRLVPVVEAYWAALEREMR